MLHDVNDDDAELGAVDPDDDGQPLELDVSADDDDGVAMDVAAVVLDDIGNDSDELDDMDR